jgi:hypothetical protein
LLCKNQIDGEEVPWLIDNVIDWIAVCVQPPELNVEIIVNASQRAVDIIQKVAIDAEKKAKAEEKRQQAVKGNFQANNKRKYPLSQSFQTESTWGPWLVGGRTLSMYR